MQIDTANMTSLGGDLNNFLIGVDVFSRMTYAGAMKGATAAEALEVFKTWPPPKIPDSDGGLEFFSVFAKYCQEHGIVQEKIQGCYQLNIDG